MSKCRVKLSNIKSFNFVQQLSRCYNQPTTQTDIHNKRKSNSEKLTNTLKCSLWTRSNCNASLTRTSQRTTKYSLYDFMAPLPTTGTGGVVTSSVSSHNECCNAERKHTGRRKGRFCSFVKELHSTRLCTAVTETDCNVTVRSIFGLINCRTELICGG